MEVHRRVTRPERVVMVADDNVDSAESLGACLRLFGYEVHLAYDGRQAIHVAAQLRPDVAVLDIGMPGANGHEVAMWIREQDWGRTTRLVALSAWGTEEMKLRSRQVGIDVHLTKPATLEDLVRAFGPVR
jgi:CheY-like chemotaxis protein